MIFPTEWYGRKENKYLSRVSCLIFHASSSNRVYVRVTLTSCIRFPFILFRKKEIDCEEEVELFSQENKALEDGVTNLVPVKMLFSLSLTFLPIISCPEKREQEKYRGF